MIGRVALAVWVAALPLHLDGHGRAIPRPRGFADVIARVALEQTDVDALTLAATLDTVAAYESDYRMTAVGDHGQSCGAWQTPCGETPVGHDVGIAQARVASKWLRYSMARCPDHPIALYATGHVCGRVRVADFYWSEVRAALAAEEVSP